VKNKCAALSGDPSSAMMPPYINMQLLIIWIGKKMPHEHHRRCMEVSNIEVLATKT
jgi:hypothetical protein